MRTQHRTRSILFISVQLYEATERIIEVNARSIPFAFWSEICANLRDQCYPI